MRKLTIILLPVFLLIAPLQSQYFYLKPQARLHIPLTSQEAPEYFNAGIVVNTNTGSYYTLIITQNRDFSLANGLSYGASAGYMFNEHVGIETGLNYFHENQNIRSDDVYPHYPIGTTSWQYRSFYATPSLVLSQTAGKFTFTMKAGFLAGLTSLGRSIFFEQKRKTFKFNTSFSSGYTIGMESSLRIRRNISVSLEAGIDNQFYKPRKALIQYDDFSYWEIDEMPVYQKEIIYVRKIDHEVVYFDSETGEYYTSYYKPMMRLKETLKLNSFYAGIGLKFNLGQNEKD